MTSADKIVYNTTDLEVTAPLNSPYEAADKSL
jgi:hypothetical protein